MTNVTAAQSRGRLLSWIALAVVYLVWGSTYLAIRVGVGHLPPLFLAGVRYVIAGSLLYPVGLRVATSRRRPGRSSMEPDRDSAEPDRDSAGPDRDSTESDRGSVEVDQDGAGLDRNGAKLSRSVGPGQDSLRPGQDSLRPGQDRVRPGVKAWLAGAVVGILLLFAGNGGLTVGETTLPSGFAAVLVATVPLWVIVFAWPVQHQRVTWRPAAGLAAGLAGVAILVGGTASGRISGVLIVLGAAAAWGFGSVLSHRLPLPPHAMLAAAIEMLAGGAVLLAVCAGTGEFSRVRWSSVPVSSWLALAYLIGPGSILAFTAYGYALSRLPVTTVSTYAYVNPVVAVLAGIVVLGEQFSWREGLGAALVVASVVITLHRSADPGGPADPREVSGEEAPVGKSRALSRS